MTCTTMHGQTPVKKKKKQFILVVRTWVIDGHITYGFYHSTNVRLQLIIADFKLKAFIGAQALLNGHTTKPLRLSSCMLCLIIMMHEYIIIDGRGTELIPVSG